MDNTLLAGRTVIEIGRELGGQITILDELRARGLTDRCRFVAEKIAGWPIARLERIVNQLPLDCGAHRLVASVGSRMPVVLLTDSFTQAANVAAARVGILHVVANPLEVENGAFTGRVLDWRIACGILSSSEVVHKGEAIHALATKFGLSPQHFAMIGDGANDIPAMEAAGLAIAIRPQPGVAECADLVVNDLSEAAEAILKRKNS